MEPWLLLALVGIGIVAYANWSPKVRQAERPEVDLQQIERTLSQFADEMSADNEQLLQSIVSMKKEHESLLDKLAVRIDLLEKQWIEMSRPGKMIDKSLNSVAVPVNTKAEEEATDSATSHDPNVTKLDEPPAVTDNIRDRYRMIFQLHDQGKSIDYIAKKVGMNKGEIQLIIQLARQEEQFRA